MLDDVLFNLSLVPWMNWLPAAIGIATALLVLFAGRFVSSFRPFARRQRSVDPFRLWCSERRQWERHDGKRVEVHIAEDCNRGVSVQGWVLDRSLDGLCLALSGKVRAGVVLQVRRTDGPHAAPWIALHVKHCRRQGGDWRVGGQFSSQGSCLGLLFE